MDTGKHDILLKFIDSGHVVGFDKRAVVTLTRELSSASSDVVIAVAVRSSSELFEELQVRIGGEIDSCCSQFQLLAPREICKTPTSLLKWGCQSIGEKKQDGSGQLGENHKCHYEYRVFPDFTIYRIWLC